MTTKPAPPCRWSVCRGCLRLRLRLYAVLVHRLAGLTPLRCVHAVWLRGVQSRWRGQGILLALHAVWNDNQACRLASRGSSPGSVTLPELASDGSLFIFMSGFPTGDLHPTYIAPMLGTHKASLSTPALLRVRIRHDHSTFNPQSKPRPRAGVRGLGRSAKNFNHGQQGSGIYHRYSGTIPARRRCSLRRGFRAEVRSGSSVTMSSRRTLVGIFPSRVRHRRDQQRNFARSRRIQIKWWITDWRYELPASSSGSRLSARELGCFYL